MNHPDQASDDDQARQELLKRIGERRARISAFLRHARPRRAVLSNISIVSSALVATLTAGPALGGQTFTQTVGESLALSQDSTVWRTLCLGALIASFAAAISANLIKSQDLTAHLSIAEACNVELEGLQTLLEFKRLNFDDAAELYSQYIAKISFL